MRSAEQQAASAFHAMGAALVALGKRVNVGSELVSLGRHLRRVSPGELAGGNLRTLRAPLDQLRGFVEALTTVAGELRVIVDALAVVIGVDN